MATKQPPFAPGDVQVTQISDGKVRFSGQFIVQPDEFVAIGLFGDSTATIQLPEGFQPTPYNRLGDVVDPAVSLEVSMTGLGRDLIVVSKGGTPFQIALTNTDLVDATAELEVFVAFHS